MFRFPAKGSTVMRHGGEPYESCSVFASDGAKFRHFGNQHCAGHWSDPRDGAQSISGLCQQIIAGYVGPDPVFQSLDMQSSLQVSIDAVKDLCYAKLLMCVYVR
nr:hypothetical protein [Paracoccus indicus]